MIKDATSTGGRHARRENRFQGDGRPDLQSREHHNPELREKGTLMVYNPLATAVGKTINVPLYYTGVTETATISHEEQGAEAHRLKRDHSVDIEVNVPARATTWYVIR